ncbi:MAG: hypothetical protein R3E96_09695 [Planctomycetota bacterium]
MPPAWRVDESDRRCGLDPDRARVGPGLARSGRIRQLLAARSLRAQLRSAAFVCGQRKVAVYTDALGQGGGFVALLLLGPKMEWDLAGVLYIQAGVWWLATIVAWWRFEGRSTRPLPARLVGRRLWRFGRWLGGMAAVQ